MNKLSSELEKTITQSDFAELVGISQPAINKHLKSGVLRKGGTAKEWLLDYTANLRIESSGRNQDDEMKAATIREKTASAQLKEVKVKQIEGTLVDMEVLFQEMQPWFSHMKGTLDTASGRIISKISTLYGVEVPKRIIEKEHRESLSKITQFVLGDKADTNS